MMCRSNTDSLIGHRINTASNGSDTCEGDVLQLQKWIYSQINEGLGEYGPAKHYK